MILCLTAETLRLSISLKTLLCAPASLR
jgi:hypothetical protein